MSSYLFVTNIDGVPPQFKGLLHGCLLSELASKLAVIAKLYFLINISNTIIYIYSARKGVRSVIWENINDAYNQ